MQALGQCAHYISENFPKAALQKMVSTAAAAQALLEDDTYAQSAAICSRFCTVVFHGLDIVEESIQDHDSMPSFDNKDWSTDWGHVRQLHPFLHSSYRPE